MKFLVVDDDHISQFLLAKSVQKAGHEAVCVGDGQKALEALKNAPFDVVLMDIELPVMDGVQATMAIRNGKVGQDKRNIPIIAVTAYAMPGDREKFIAAGMNHYLSKPVDEFEFAKALAIARQLVAICRPS